MPLNLEPSTSPNPPRIVIYGPPGIGKTTWACSAPNPVVIRTEDGMGMLDAKRFPLCHTVADVVAQLNEVATQEHDFATLVLDSFTALDRFIEEDVCQRGGKEVINDVGGGYGKGGKLTEVRWRSILQLLTRISTQRGMIVVAICHDTTVKIEAPDGASYTRFDLRFAGQKNRDLVTEWADAVLYAHREIVTRQTEEGFGAKRNIAVPVGKDGGNRRLRTCELPSVVAKNRYALAEILPLPEVGGWDVVFPSQSEE